MKGNDLRRLERIRTYCADVTRTIIKFGDDYDIFINDRIYRNAISMCLMQIGELSKGISEEFKIKTGNKIQWKMLKSMRNLFAHDYDSMNLDIIWQSAKQDIPLLFLICDEILVENPDI